MVLKRGVGVGAENRGFERGERVWREESCVERGGGLGEIEGSGEGPKLITRCSYSLFEYNFPQF